MELQHLKLLARRIRALLQQSNISINHSQSLDLVATVPGLRNWPEVQAFPDRIMECVYDTHAVQRLSARIQKRYGLSPTRELLSLSNELDAQPGFPIYLSAHWFDRERLSGVDQRSAGREILQIQLSKPLTDVVAKHQLPVARGLRGYRMEYMDHVEHLTDFTSCELARKSLAAAARALHFMDATGLRPVTTQAYARQMHVLDRMPAKDHASEWFDPGSGAWLFLDEPYELAMKAARERRTEWLTRNRLHEVKPAWGGLYLPGECPPYLISNDPVQLDAVAARLAKLQTFLVPDPWPFESGSNGVDFVSPMREAAGKPRRSRPGPSYFDHKGARPYGGAPGIKSRRRPIQPMPLESHRVVGEFFQRLSGHGLPWRLSNKVGRQRALLEDWAIFELRDHAGGDVTDDLYYGGPSRSTFPSRAAMLESLVQVRALIVAGYNECKPRAELLSVLDELALAMRAESDGAETTMRVRSGARQSAD